MSSKSIPPSAVAPLRRLDDATLSQLPDSVRVPAYDRAATRIGIVHLGAGAFHRAHQAVYIDDLLAMDPTWAICAVSLNRPDVRDALRPQDGLYTVALLEEPPVYRVIGAIREVLCAVDEGERVLARLADPHVRLVTLTVTEKGYCFASDGLDTAHPDIVHDLAQPEHPRTAIGYLVAGLRLRWQGDAAPFTVLSCDNLADNGGRLRRATLQYAAQIDPVLTGWIEAHVQFPSSMVDSITPGTDDALRARVASALGVQDAWPVQRETYTQWVVEDALGDHGPDLQRVGVTMTLQVSGHDRAKLRLLNAPHSAMAYLGSLLGLETVAEAMRHPALSAFIEVLMRTHIAPNAELPAELDADAYIGAILARFANPLVRHRLAQIAQDGSQKIPVRYAGTIAQAVRSGRSLDVLCLPVAGWMHFVRRQAKGGIVMQDPLGDALTGVAARCTGDAAVDVPAFLALPEMVELVHGQIMEALQRAYAALGAGEMGQVQAALEAYR